MEDAFDTFVLVLMIMLLYMFMISIIWVIADVVKHHFSKNRQI